jgi:hypothetical protein
MEVADQVCRTDKIKSLPSEMMTQRLFHSPNIEGVILSGVRLRSNQTQSKDSLSQR